MPETIALKKLGPITEAKIEVRPLTVLIGPQASGKSLIAQSLYFFRTLPSRLARKFAPGMADAKGWQNNVIRELLDSLRGVAFGYFADGTAELRYNSDEYIDKLIVKIYKTNRTTKINSFLENVMEELVREWEVAPFKLGHIRSLFTKPEIFIPTERSMFTRFMAREPSILFDNNIQPETSIQFANYLMSAQQGYQTYYWNTDGHYELFKYFVDSQARALSGIAYLPKTGRQAWKWRVVDDPEAIANDPEGHRRGKATLVPIEATASGQMEAWPFFAVAATYGTAVSGSSFYFEEPETHLHPAAQMEVVKAIAKLVSHGRRMIVTTHSPFILYLINNMMLNHLSLPEGQRDDRCLDPNLVTAYRMHDGKAVKIMDHEAEEPLIDSAEFDRISDQLGGEFDAILDRLAAKNEQ